MSEKKCYCQSGLPFSACCEPYLSGRENAPSPEALMRSRYSAFCLKNMDYVLETTDPQARFSFDPAANEEWARTSEFTNLEILKSSAEGNKGMVEFKAHFQTKGEEPQIHHEVSKFRKQSGVWYFRDGKTVNQEPKK